MLEYIRGDKASAKKPLAPISRLAWWSERECEEKWPAEWQAICTIY